MSDLCVGLQLVGTAEHCLWQLELLAKMRSAESHNLPLYHSNVSHDWYYQADASLSLLQGWKPWADFFQNQYHHLKPLCLTCKNECGIQKLIMTFIKVDPADFYS